MAFQGYVSGRAKKWTQAGNTPLFLTITLAQAMALPSLTYCPPARADRPGLVWVALAVPFEGIIKPRQALPRAQGPAPEWPSQPLASTVELGKITGPTFRQQKANQGRPVLDCRVSSLGKTTHNLRFGDLPASGGGFC